MKKNIYFIFSLLFLLFSTNAYLLAQIKIAAIFPNKDESKWLADSKAIENLSAEMGATYFALYGSNTIESQEKLVERAARSGVDVIILPVVEPKSSYKIITKAQIDGIKVVTYLNPPDTARGVSMHIAFDYSRAGYNQILYTFNKIPFGTYLFMMGIPTDHRFLDSYKGSIEAFRIAGVRSAIKIIAQSYQIGWKNEDIKQFVKNAIRQNPDISVIVIPDDAMSVPVAAAIRELRLEKPIFISGQNLTPISAGYILDDIQIMSTYPHQSDLATEAAKIAYKLAARNDEDDDIETNDNNNPVIASGVAIPTYYIYPQIIDKDNFQKMIINKGYIKTNVIFQSTTKK